jgi:hypothetical protein
MGEIKEELRRDRERVQRRGRKVEIKEEFQRDRERMVLGGEKRRR